MFLDEINKTLDTFEEMKRKEEKLRDLAVAEKRHRRELNGKLMEQCVQKVISPVFHEAQKQIEKRDFFCSVEIISKKDAGAETATPVAVSIKLSVKPGSEKQAVDTSQLAYEGGFEDQGVTRKGLVYARIGADPEVESSRIVVTDVDIEMVESDVAKFIGRVFKGGA